MKSSIEAAATATNERLEQTGRRDAQDLVITREKLVDAVEELEHLRWRQGKYARHAIHLSSRPPVEFLFMTVKANSPVFSPSFVPLLDIIPRISSQDCSIATETGGFAFIALFR